MRGVGELGSGGWKMVLVVAVAFVVVVELVAVLSDSACILFLERIPVAEHDTASPTPTGG